MSETAFAHLSLGLDHWPETLYIGHDRELGLYACRDCGVIGLAAFSNESDATEYLARFERTSLFTQEVSFEEARQIAKDRPLPVVALLLLDDLENPVIHYVR